MILLVTQITATHEQVKLLKKIIPRMCKELVVFAFQNKKVVYTDIWDLTSFTASSMLQFLERNINLELSTPHEIIIIPR